MKPTLTKILALGVVCATCTIVASLRPHVTAADSRARKQEQQGPRSTAVPMNQSPLAVSPVDTPDHALVQALVKMDKLAVENMLDADFMWTDSAGETLGRTKVLASPPKPRLFDIFRGPRFSLLSLGMYDSPGLNQVSDRFKQNLQAYTIDRGASATAAGNHQLIDDQGHVLHAYGGENGALFLIRPDGYIGFIGGSKSIGSVESYLEQIYSER